MNPVWEHGYRCHGYWLGDVRVGYVSLPPQFGGGAKTGGYGWGVLRPGTKSVNEVEGRVKTLREGKRKVEAEYRRIYT